MLSSPTPRRPADGRLASGRVTLHAAIAHISHVSTYDDPDDVCRACDHIISSVERSGTVRRVVVTSSLAAVISEADIHELARRPVVDEARSPDESNPKRVPERGQGYFPRSSSFALGGWCRTRR